MQSLNKTIILCVLVFAVGSFLQGTLYTSSARAEVVFSEDFESSPPHPLQDSYSTTEVIATAVWNNVPPTGWTIDNSQMSSGGVPEFTGWVFLDLTWWDDTASGQNRRDFDSERTSGALGYGTAAVADGDEWWDQSTGGLMHTWISTPAIDTSGHVNLEVAFDSSWQMEVTQEASLEVSYDGGPKQLLFHWNCVSGDPDFHDTNFNEHITVSLNNADSVVLTFGYYNANNDWWWAFDNVQVTGDSALVLVSPLKISVSEDPLSDPCNYEIVLGTAPTHSVEVTATPSDAQIDLGNGAGTATTLTFTTGNWNTSQTVTVTAFDDDVYEGPLPHSSTISHTSQSDDTTFVGIIIPLVTVEVYDDDEICGDWGYLPTDLNKDCYVDLEDFAWFALRWLDTSN